jgi:S-adenosylmethionine hydrolase
MIFTFTDFGWQGPYLGEMRTAVLRVAPDVPYVDLMVDAPAFRPDLAAYLLAAHATRLWIKDVVIAVVDPGVGTDRAPLAIRADQIWYTGPDNGLFEIIMRRAGQYSVFEVKLRPSTLSATFHGRDLFAPVAARLAKGARPGLDATKPTRFPDMPDELDRIVHIDGYGNLITGRRAATVPPDAVLVLDEHRICHARTFGDVTPGTLFWYANSIGLLEIAQSGGSAAAALRLAIGDAAPVASGPAAA